MLIDYIEHGTATFPYTFAMVLGREEDGAAAAAYRVIIDCLVTLTEFLHVCATYDVHEAGLTIYEPLTMCVSLAQSYGIAIKTILIDDHMGAVFMVAVFNTLPHLPGGNPVIVFLAQTLVADTMIDC